LGLISDRWTGDWGIVGAVDPIDASNADSDSDVLATSMWLEVIRIIALNVLNDSATCTVTIKDSPTSGGAYSAIAGKTQSIVGTDDAKQFIICAKDEELNTGARYIKSTMDNSAHSQLMCIIALGKAKYRPATDDYLATVQTPMT
jgi:hypothetical protein